MSETGATMVKLTWASGLKMLYTSRISCTSANSMPKLTKTKWISCTNCVHEWFYPIQRHLQHTHNQKWDEKDFDVAGLDGTQATKEEQVSSVHPSSSVKRWRRNIFASTTASTLLDKGWVQQLHHQGCHCHLALSIPHPWQQSEQAILS